MTLNNERQALYRKRKRAGGLCIVPGCWSKVEINPRTQRQYARCADCRYDQGRRSQELRRERGE